MKVNQKKEVRTAEQVLTILSDTPLKFLVESLRYGLGDFDFRTDPVAESEVIIGEMTDLERIIHAATMNARRCAAEIGKANNAMVQNTFDPENPDFCHRVQLNKGEFEALDLLDDALNALKWYSIKRRIGIPATEPDGIAIRDGCVVVARTSEAVENDFRVRVLSQLASRLGISDY